MSTANFFQGGAFAGRMPAGLALLGTFLLAGCGDSIGVDGPQDVTLSFRTAEVQPSSAPAADVIGPAGAPIQFDGTNGTLVIDQVLMIVSEVELDSEDSCDDDDAPSGESFDDCEDFEADPYLVDLPLDGSPISVFSALIAPGVYDELEFEIEDIDLDDLGDDDEKERGIMELRDQVRALVPDWPEKASMYVTGTFQPMDGEPEAFRTFIEAEIEVELDLIPNLVIGEDGMANRDLIVDVRPDLWFIDHQGQVRDLREWDYDTTGRILELEIEIENGFIEVEFDD